MSRSLPYVPGEPVVGRYLVCPQLKQIKDDRLFINWHTTYVLEHFAREGESNNQVLVHEGAKNSVTGLPAIASRLTRAGMLEDIRYDSDAGYIRRLSSDGHYLLGCIRREVAAGAVLKRRTDPRFGAGS